MKVKFIMHVEDICKEEIVEVDESKIKGNGYMASNELYIKASNWASAKIYVDFKVLDDERFPDGNIPFVDEELKEKLGWDIED